MENVEKEFIESWNQVENNISKNNIFPPNIENSILELIKEMRSRGFDKTLRAGQSMYDFILSRASKHGLSNEQTFIIFRLNDIFPLMQQKKAIDSIKDQLTPEEYQEFQKKFEGINTDLVKIIISHKGKQEETISEIKYTPQIESLLQWLEKEEID